MCKGDKPLFTATCFSNSSKSCRLPNLVSVSASISPPLCVYNKDLLGFGNAKTEDLCVGNSNAAIERSRFAVLRSCDCFHPIKRPIGLEKRGGSTTVQIADIFIYKNGHGIWEVQIIRNLMTDYKLESSSDAPEDGSWVQKAGGSLIERETLQV